MKLTYLVLPGVTFEAPCSPPTPKRRSKWDARLKEPLLITIACPFEASGWQMRASCLGRITPRWFHGDSPSRLGFYFRPQSPSTPKPESAPAVQTGLMWLVSLPPCAHSCIVQVRTGVQGPSLYSVILSPTHHHTVISPAC